MNNFKIEVKKYPNHVQATKGVNEFIQECNNNGVKILDITSHYNSYDTDESFADDVTA
ncbi:hypothetical protein ABRT01_03620 [Lentibacillus sp. L22]|uniref:hypothetical protein n=1 Tax=Lentibacillus sp. L22 TaxID=3163028 RepID=UPI0034666024